ncbi:hypothetical protein [Sphingomonas sp. M1-B02]|uniref:hypothetical protein n=1 Tax=Sphingomonas sp. M1-B02 TaxID=3114300 RepID=UPI00223E9997|nr:hypothetical protein [Sphingomonas sp. S6-11]UZK65864.1 hypothetical protein OKW87_15340 [Sphingomonas sp. S6-11]
MAGVRSMLARVTRLEVTDAPAQSPFEHIYGSLAGFTQVARAAIKAGTLDRRDGGVLLEIIRRWHADRVWDVWQ